VIPALITASVMWTFYFIVAGLALSSLHCSLSLVFAVSLGIYMTHFDVVLEGLGF
jgi:hypothetical protein